RHTRFGHSSHLLHLLRPPTTPLLPYTTLFRSFQFLQQPGRLPGGLEQRRDGGTDRRHGDPARGQDVERLEALGVEGQVGAGGPLDRKSTRLNSSHVKISYAVFRLKKKKKIHST